MHLPDAGGIVTALKIQIIQIIMSVEKLDSSSIPGAQHLILLIVANTPCQQVQPLLSHATSTFHRCLRDANLMNGCSSLINIIFMKPVCKYVANDCMQMFV